MKTLKLILGTCAIGLSSVFAQEDMETKCRDYRMIASDSKMVGDFREAATYYWKIEQNCEADENIYANIRYCIESLMPSITDENEQKLYRDSLIMAYERQEAKFGKDENWTLWHAYYLTANKSTNYQKIDELFTYSIDKLQEKTGASFISTYYYNLILRF
jgi:hypothetical protein